MTCSRCAGLMVEDYFINIDIDAPSGTEKLAAWRCINCGDIVERIGARIGSANDASMIKRI